MKYRGLQTMSAAEVDQACREVVVNAIIREPKLPAANLVDGILAEKRGESPFVQKSEALLAKFLVALAREEQRKARKAARHPLFPEWDELPTIIVLPDRRRIAIEKANVSAARALVSREREKWRVHLRAMGDRAKAAKKQKPARLVQAEKFLELMEKEAKKHYGITAKEVAREL